mgnify:CR=1 FL=1
MNCVHFLDHVGRVVNCVILQALKKGDKMSSWGILGNPTAEQIEQWKTLPYGHFGAMVSSLKKRYKGKSLRMHAVEVKKSITTSTKAFAYVQAFNVDHAISQVREINILDLEWSEPKAEPETISYSVSQIW